MIMARNGRIAPRTGRDHDERRNVAIQNPDIRCITGLASPLQAGSRRFTTAGRQPRRPPSLVQPAARILTSSKAPKFGTHEFLIFLALCPSNTYGPSLWVR